MFQDDVYRVVQKIPKGKVATYGQVANIMGKPNAARAVGNALNKNPDTKKPPCHRVVRSSGIVGGFAFGSEKKKKKLRDEGIYIKKDSIDLSVYQYTP